MKKLSLTTTLFAIWSAGTVIAGPVQYHCEYDGDRSRGWIPDFALVTVDEEAGTVTASASNFPETEKNPFEGQLRANARRVIATFQTDEARTSTGRKIYVRYSFRMNRSDLSSTLSVQVNRHGQQERSNGHCRVQS